MKYISKNNVILKTQDMSKKKQNYNETVIFRLYFDFISKSSTYRMKHILETDMET